MAPRSRTSAYLTRRQALLRAGGIGGAAMAARAALASRAWGELVQRAATARPAGSDLGAVEHLVFLTMENRSYDCYFGAYAQGRGFNDHPRRSLGAFAQAYPDGTGLEPPGVLLPFHFDQQCQNDPTHDWGPQHLCWDGGSNGAFVRTHTSSQYEGSGGTTVMGYYDRRDLGFYWALADAFTLCDGYHASVLGPTHPNRLMQMSGTIDPAGTAGGPITDTNASPQLLWSCSWPTMPELLQDAGVSWKVYSPSNVTSDPKYAYLAGPDYKDWNPALYSPDNPEVMAISDHVLPYFAAYRSPLSPLHQKAFTPTFPNDFASDVAAGTLPSVSWICPPLGWDEHPSASPARGMTFASMVLDALTANPDLWAKTALFITHDENGGFFDHVPPPVPPAGTAGEYLTAAPKGGNPAPDTLGFTGPVGLGFRVPMLVVSPFSRGGHIATETFDHTSQLKLIAERFGVAVPNVSAWRRQAVGDLTSALFGGTPSPSVPVLPAIAIPSSGACATSAQDSELGGSATVVSTRQEMPRQESTRSGSSGPHRRKRRRRRKHHHHAKHHRVTRKHHRARPRLERPAS